MHIFCLFTKNMTMKLSTKIFLGLFVLTLIPAIWLGQYFIAGIIPTETGFTFKFSALGIAGIVFMIINQVFGGILFLRFLKSLTLPKAIFFSVVPLTVIYGVLLFLIADITRYDNPTAKSVRILLNLETGNNYNTILWAVLLSVVYISALFLIFILLCKPVSRMEKIVNRLSDGKVKEPHFKLGGGKQFKELEHSLNKINYNYNAKDNAISQNDQEIRKFIPKEFFKFLGKNHITELELGQQVKKHATILFCDLKSKKSSEKISLEENFNFISSYMNTVAPIIKRYNGFIDKYLGDGVLAVFSRPENALDCAHQIVKAIEVKNRPSKDNIVESSISLHTGDVIFGIIGDEDRMTPTIVSDIVTFVERQNQINTLLGSKLIFSKVLLGELPTRYKLYYRYVGSLSCKNGGEQIPIFESLEVYPKDKREKLASLKTNFEQGVRDYNDKNYENSKANLAEVLRYVPDDKPSYLYFNKASEKIDNN